MSNAIRNALTNKRANDKATNGTKNTTVKRFTAIRASRFTRII